MTRWWLIGAALLIAALIISSIALALLSEETEFEPGTAEAAVQNLLRAAEGEDFQTAYNLLSQDLQGKCSLEDFVKDNGYRFDDARDIRATLRDAKQINDATLVSVNITRFHNNGPFDTYQSSSERRFTLRQEDGDWRFTEYPWPYDYCTEEKDN